MFEKKRKIDELKKENELLRKEIDRLKASEYIYKDSISKCEQMKDEWRRAIAEAKKSQANYNTLYKELKLLMNKIQND